MNIPDPAVFSLAFVDRMRRQKNPRFSPTVRTSQGLVKLLVVRRLRKGRLTVDDFIQCAVLVTEPEDQQTAMDVALSILSAPVSIFGKRRGKDWENSSIAQMMEEMTKGDRDEISPEEGFKNLEIEDLLTDPVFAEIIKMAGGIEAAKSRFSSPLELKDFGKKTTRELMGGFDENSFALALGLGMVDQVVI